MPNLKLYYMDLSPPSNAVLLTANLLDLKLELIVVNIPALEHLKPEFLKLNPQHTIPVLIDDETVIYDSHSIITYLVGKYATTPAQRQLYPVDLVQRACVDALLHFNSCFLWGRYRSLLEPILYNGATQVDPAHVTYMAISWHRLEAFLERATYLCGEQLTLGDIACAASVCSANILVPIDAAQYPKLLQWIDRLLKELPNFKRDCLDNGVKMQTYFEAKALSNRNL